MKKQKKNSRHSRDKIAGSDFVAGMTRKWDSNASGTFSQGEQVASACVVVKNS